MKVDENVLVNGVLVIAKGTPVRAEVNEAKGSGMFGKAGKLSLRIESTTAVDGQKVPLTGSPKASGKSRQGTMVAVTLLVSPVGVFLKGKNATYPEGTRMTVYTDEIVAVTPSAAARSNPTGGGRPLRPRTHHAPTPRGHPHASSLGRDPGVRRRRAGGRRADGPGPERGRPARRVRGAHDHAQDRHARHQPGRRRVPAEAMPVNFREVADRLKDNGTAIKMGQQVMVTKVVVKKSHIEFQLGGGGYGTFGDWATNGTNVSTSGAGESAQERGLRESIKQASGDDRSAWSASSPGCARRASARTTARPPRRSRPTSRARRASAPGASRRAAASTSATSRASPPTP
jgi:hypothetical protein